MKIAFAHYSSLNDISGVTTWLVDFMNYLSDYGHIVKLHLHHYGKNPQNANILKKLKIDSGNITFHTRISLEKDIEITLKWLNEVKPDIFLPQCLHSHYFAASISGNFGLPWIFTFHSDDPAYWFVADKLKPSQNNGFSACVSEEIYNKYYLEYDGVNSCYIPYGVKCMNMHTSYSENKFQVIYVGRLVNEQKQIMKVVKTFIAACQYSPKLKFVIIGDGNERKKCEEEVIQNCLSDRIIFTGILPAEEISDILLNSQAILLMSDYEGLPLSLLEAMSHGVVPIVKKIKSGIPELIKHELTGLLIDGDINSGVNAILYLLKNKIVWQKLSHNASSHILKNYDQQSMFLKYLKLIEMHSSIKNITYPVNTSVYLEKNILYDQRLQIVKKNIIPYNLFDIIKKTICSCLVSKKK